MARLELAARRENGRIHLEARMTSNGEEPVKIALRHRCPNGPISFVGLGEDFDYYGTCNMGACAEPESVTHLTVPAGGERVTVVALSWPEGGDGCRRPLPFGRHDLNAWGDLLEPEGSNLCGLPHAQLDLPAPPRPAPKSPPEPEVRCPPMPTCGLACDGPFAKDEHGCTQCACEPDPWGTRSPRRPSPPPRPTPSGR